MKSYLTSSKSVQSLVFILLLFFLFEANAQTRVTALESPTWYGKYRNTDTVVIFIHGIFGNSNTFLYKDENNESQDRFWPEMLTQDKNFERISIYLGNYFTNVGSQGYGLNEATEDLWSALNRPDDKIGRAVLDHKNIIFVGHSTGGILIRNLIGLKKEHLKDKKIGVTLIASPSRGSRWADRLSSISKLFNNKLASELKENSPPLLEIHNRFQRIITNRELDITGIEAIENVFIYNCYIFYECSAPIVTADSASVYFEGAKVLAGTNHFSSVKPDSTLHPTYVLFSDFYRTHFKAIVKELDLEPPKAAKFELQLITNEWVPTGSNASTAIQIDARICNGSSDANTMKSRCTLSLNSIVSTPPKIGDIKISNPEIKCIGSLCNRFGFSWKLREVYTNEFVQSVTAEILASAQPQLEGSAAENPLQSGAPESAQFTEQTVFVLSAPTMRLTKLNVGTQISFEKSFGEKFSINIPNEKTWAQIRGRVFFDDFQISSDAPNSNKYINLITSGQVGSSFFYEYLLDRPKSQ